MKTRILFIFMIANFVWSANALDKGPIAISPGSDVGAARIGVSSPTFSWTSVDWAKGYQVVIFETNGPNVLDFIEMEAIASPILKKEIRGRALSWTPSSDEILLPGREYVWYVQAVDEYNQGIWSEGRVFQVDISSNYYGMRENVRKRLEKKGLSKETIEGVLDELSQEMRDTMHRGVAPIGIVDSTFSEIGIQSNDVGSNTYYGEFAGSTLSSGTGTNNTFMGQYAGQITSDGADNTFIGYGAGRYNDSGNFNTFMGSNAGILNIEGNYNTFLGYYSGLVNGTGNTNTFIGYFTGLGNTTGSSNTFVGSFAGSSNVSGDGNLFLGYQAGYNETGSNKLYIDNSTTDSPLIWGDFENDILTVHGKIGLGTQSPAYQIELETTGENAILLLERTDGATTGFSASGNKCAFGTMTNHPLWMVINGAFSAIFHTDGSLQMMNGAWCTAAGKWQDASSRELKENIQSLTLEEAKQALEGLDPVRFNYKADKDDESLGFIAEDVPELVASKDRKSMSAMDVVTVLTKVVQEQQKTISELQKQIDELKSREKEISIRN